MQHLRSSRPHRTLYLGGEIRLQIQDKYETVDSWLIRNPTVLRGIRITLHPAETTGGNHHGNLCRGGGSPPETVALLVHSDNCKATSQLLTAQQAAAINPFYSNTVWTRQERKGRLALHKPDRAHCRAATPAAKFIINSINVMLQKKHANIAKGYILFPLKHI